jgi:hypothetical protein
MTFEENKETIMNINRRDAEPAEESIGITFSLCAISVNSVSLW